MVSYPNVQFRMTSAPCQVPRPGLSVPLVLEEASLARLGFGWGVVIAPAVSTDLFFQSLLDLMTHVPDLIFDGSVSVLNPTARYIAP